MRGKKSETRKHEPFADLNPSSYPLSVSVVCIVLLFRVLIDACAANLPLNVLLVCDDDQISTSHSYRMRSSGDVKISYE